MHTVKHCAEHRIATGLGEYPGPVLPGRIVSYMLRVAALEVGDPMPFLVDVKADDPSRYAPRSAQIVRDP